VRILVLNDDGIYSPGDRGARLRCERFGDVRVVAPGVERSSAGHAITSSRQVRYRRALRDAGRRNQATLPGIRGIAPSTPITDEAADLPGLEPWVVRVLQTLPERD
jgi:5'/3'-nucleotidase SurE